MRELFNDILSVEGVKGLILFSFSGKIIFKEHDDETLDKMDARQWRIFIDSLTGIRESDLIFEKGRLYIRKSEIGYLVVIIGPFVPMAMMRLQCDILLPSLKTAKAPKGIRRFFKK